MAMFQNKLIRSVLVMIILACGLLSTTAQACSVCGGDKNSDMVKGALSGVVVMVIITYGLLMSFAALIVTWFVRARRLAVAKPMAKNPLDGDSNPS